MSGASLWLVPPKDSPIDTILTQLIMRAVPQHFPQLKSTPTFSPHLTLTSDIAQDAVSERPQSWLDSLPLALDRLPHVMFETLDVGEPFFRKLTLSTAKDPLLEVAVQIRATAVENGDAAAARRWAEDVYAPHVSLLYADLEITEEKRVEILGDLDRVGIKLKNEGALRGEENEGYDGWAGGKIVLVSTWKKLEDWAVTAERPL